MVKPMPTLGVLGVATGRVLKDAGFMEIHQTLDHLYPGIMTIGCAIMAETAKVEILKQIPEIKELGECTIDNWADYAERGLTRFGTTMNIEGPHGTGKPDMEGVGLNG